MKIHIGCGTIAGTVLLVMLFVASDGKPRLWHFVASGATSAIVSFAIAKTQNEQDI